MKKTVQDLEEYVYNVCAGIGDTSNMDKNVLAEEINAVQQLYFERFCCETAVYQAPHTSSFAVAIQEQQEMAPVEFSDLLAVFLDDLPLPLMKTADYYAGTRPAATMENGRLLYRGEGAAYRNLTVIYRQRPADVAYRDGMIEGGIYLPLKHLPLLGNKIRECFSRTNFDYADADCYAKAYNNWLTVLEGYAGSMKEGNTAIRAAL